VETFWLMDVFLSPCGIIKILLVLVELALGTAGLGSYC